MRSEHSKSRSPLMNKKGLKDDLSRGPRVPEYSYRDTLFRDVQSPHQAIGAGLSINFQSNYNIIAWKPEKPSFNIKMGCDGFL